jgi:hypothetical protein
MKASSETHARRITTAVHVTSRIVWVAMTTTRDDTGGVLMPTRPILRDRPTD